MDSILEGVWSGSALGAGCVGVIVEPGGVGGQLAFSCLHLVDSSCQKLPQTHKGVWGEGGGVFVVRGGGCISVLVLEEQVPNVVPECTVRLSHELWGRDLCPGWRGGMQN